MIDSVLHVHCIVINAFSFFIMCNVAEQLGPETTLTYTLNSYLIPPVMPKIKTNFRSRYTHSLFLDVKRAGYF